jgi:hypothetical protein
MQHCGIAVGVIGSVEVQRAPITGAVTLAIVVYTHC